MRRRRTDLAARVNGDLALEFTDVALTSYAGLELFGRYLRATRFNPAYEAGCSAGRMPLDFHHGLLTLM